MQRLSLPDKIGVGTRRGRDSLRESFEAKQPAPPRGCPFEHRLRQRNPPPANLKRFGGLRVSLSWIFCFFFAVYGLCHRAHPERSQAGRDQNCAGWPSTPAVSDPNRQQRQVAARVVDEGLVLADGGFVTGDEFFHEV